MTSEAESHALLALTHAPDLLIVVDADMRAVWASSAVSRVLGHGPGEMLGTQLYEHVHPDDLDHALGALNEAVRGDGYHLATRIRVRRVDGAFVDTRVTSTTFGHTDGVWMVLALRPVEDEVAIEQRRLQLKALAQSLYVSCAAMHWYENTERVSSLLAELSAVVGATAIELAEMGEDAGGTTFLLRCSWGVPDHAVRELALGGRIEPVAAIDELRHRPCVLTHLAGAGFAEERSGDKVVVELWLDAAANGGGLLRLGFDRVSPDWDDANADVIALMSSTLLATMRRCQEERRLHDEATRDPLTRLLNRSALFDQLSTMMERRRTGGGDPVVLFADLNSFKHLNDEFGHREGDRALRTVAQAISDQVRPRDLAARVGGDEFVIVFDAPQEAAGELVSRVRGAVDRAVSRWPGLSVAVGAIAVGPYGTPADVLERADMAMYRDKQRAQGADDAGDRPRPARSDRLAAPNGDDAVGRQQLMDPS